MDYLFFKFYLEKHNWEILLRDDKNDYSFSYEDWVNPNKQINLKKILTGRILCGFKIRHDDMKWLARMIMTGNASPEYLYANKNDDSWDYYNKFLALDLVDVIGRDGEIIGLACALGEDVNFIEKNHMELYYNILKWALKKYEFEISMKFSFMESDNFDFKTCLEKNSNKLTSLAIYNNTCHKLNDDEVFSLDFVDERLANWLKMYVPGKILNFFLSFSYNEIKNIIENRPEMLEFYEFGNKIKIGLGGIHFECDEVYFESNDEHQVVHDDGASFYPMMMIKHGTLSRRANKKKVVKYIDDRFEVKGKPGKKLEDNKLKVKINSIFGQSKAKGLIYDPTMLYRTCVLGQLILIAYSNNLYKEGHKIAQGNTDGIYALIKKSKWDEYLKLQNEISDITRIKFDSDEVKFMYQMNVNNYICVYEDGNIDALGSNLCGDWTGENIRYNSKKTYPIVHKAVKQFLVDGIDVEETILECKKVSMFILTLNNDSYDCAFFGTKSTKSLDVNELKKHDVFRAHGNKVSKDMKIKSDIINKDFVFDESIRHFRLLPVKGTKRQIIFFNKSKEGLSVGANQSPRMELVMNKLDEYNLDEFDIDYDFLIAMAKKRLEKF